MSGSRGSGFDIRWLQISFFFTLVEKIRLQLKKISKCRENGIDRLRNGNLPAYPGQLHFGSKKQNMITKATQSANYDPESINFFHNLSYCNVAEGQGKGTHGRKQTEFFTTRGLFLTTLYTI